MKQGAPGRLPTGAEGRAVDTLRRRNEVYGMNEAMNDLLKKVRASATVAGEYATRAASNVGKKASDAFNVSKLNIQIFDLNTSLDVIYKEIGKIIYDSHTGKETDNTVLEEKLRQADEKAAQIQELKDKIANHRDTKACENCGNSCGKDDVYCAKCGAKVGEEPAEK